MGELEPVPPAGEELAWGRLHYVAAGLLLESGRLEEAIIQLERSTRLAPDRDRPA